MRELIAALERAHGRQKPRLTDPFQQVLWENVAYLVDDDRRAAAFDELPSMTVKALAKAKQLPPRVRECIDIALELGEPLEKLARGPLPAARQALKQFPGIGAPGADRILLLAGAHPVFAVESNGLRVLARVLFGAEETSYAETYQKVMAALGPARDDLGFLQRATLVLRVHGQAICKRNKPACDICPVSPQCAFAGA
jgi:endonuclease III